MNLWQRLVAWFQRPLAPAKARVFELTPSLQDTLAALARQTGVPETRLAEDLITAGLDALQSREWLWQCWLTLTPREQQVVALTCRGYTNRQIAAHLGIAPDTVKSHLRNALGKFGLHTKGELRLALAAWDFSAWENPAPPPKG